MAARRAAKSRREEGYIEADLAGLDERRRAVFTAKRPPKTPTPPTNGELGKRLGLSTTRIRQIDLEAAAKVAQAIRARLKRKRAVSPSSVTHQLGPAGDAKVGAPSPSVTRDVTGVAPRHDGVGAIETPIRDSDDLEYRLLKAANNNVRPAAHETIGVIEDLIADEGCDLDLDILPVVQEMLRHPDQGPIKTWGVPWLLEAVRAKRDARRSAAKPRAAPFPATAMAPAARPRPLPDVRADGPGYDMSELGAGYQASTLNWNTARLGPPPGAPGCRVDPAILLENGFRW
jgi:hypothetical protein